MRVPYPWLFVLRDCPLVRVDYLVGFLFQCSPCSRRLTDCFSGDVRRSTIAGVVIRVTEEIQQDSRSPRVGPAISGVVGFVSTLAKLVLGHCKFVALVLQRQMQLCLAGGRQLTTSWFSSHLPVPTFIYRVLVLVGCKTSLQIVCHSARKPGATPAAGHSPNLSVFLGLCWESPISCQTLRLFRRWFTTTEANV